MNMKCDIASNHITGPTHYVYRILIAENVKTYDHFKLLVS